MSNNIVIGKHTLESLTSGMYSDPFVVFREYIQNSVDSVDTAYNAGILKKGEEQINIQLLPSEKRIIITDNGIGIPAKIAEKTLISIGNSKKKSETSRGFRGIGRLSGLSYCKQLTFETSHYGDGSATRLTVNAERLLLLLSSAEHEDATVVDVLSNVYTCDTFSEKESAHYFTVIMDGIYETTDLTSYEKVVDYLSQNIPVPYNPVNFVWGKEITRRLKKENYRIKSYNISVTFGRNTIPIYKSYKDSFVVDKGKNIIDTIQDVEIVKIFKRDGSLCAVGWIAKTNYCGSIHDKSIKGIRLRKGNILVGDHQTLNVIFRDARFNGWSIGEIFTINKLLIPNARRDNFEKNEAYFLLLEQLSTIAARITKEIRAASLHRNTELSKALEQTRKAQEAVETALNEGISSRKKGALTQKILSTQKAVVQTSPSEDSDMYYQGIAFEELDMLMGRLKGATSYKALNSLNKLTNTEKRILERVFNTITNSGVGDADKVIDAIIEEFYER